MTRRRWTMVVTAGAACGLICTSSAGAQTDREERLRQAKARHSTRMAEVSARLIKQLQEDENPEVRANAARRLGESKVAEAVPVLTAALSDPAGPVRANAAHALWMLAPASKSAVPALEKVLADSYPRSRVYAAGALNRLESSTPARLAGIVEPLLRDGHPTVRAGAADVASALDLGDETVRRVVAAALGHSDPAVRQAIVDGLADAELAGPVAAAIVPGLAHAIRSDAEIKVRTGALLVAQRIAPMPNELRGAIEATLTDPHPEVRDAATLAFNHVSGVAQRSELDARIASTPDDPEAIRALIARMQAAPTLEGPAVALVEQLRRGATEQARADAARSLGQLSAYGDPAARALAEALPAEKSRKVKITIANALDALGHVGEAGPVVATALVQVFQTDTDAAVREAVARALVNPGRDQPAIVLPILNAALQDPDDGVRLAAQEALKRIGPR